MLISVGLVPSEVSILFQCLMDIREGNLRIDLSDVIEEAQAGIGNMPFSHACVTNSFVSVRTTVMVEKSWQGDFIITDSGADVSEVSEWLAMEPLFLSMHDNPSSII